MAITLPQIGETYVGTNPAILKVAKVSFGASSAGVDVALTAAGAYNLVNVPAGTLLLGVKTRVTEAFAGSTPTLVISDSDLSIALSATIAPASTGILLKMDGVGGGVFEATGFKVGRVYDASGVIKVTLGDTACAAGRCEVFIEYAEFGSLL